MVAVAVSPFVVASDAAGLLSFLADVLGAVELGRVPGPDGRIGHAEVVLGGTTLVVVDALDGWASSPVLVRVHVDDLAAVLAGADGVEARLVTETTLLPQGVAAARLADPWGNLWLLEQQVEDVDVPDLIARLGDPATVALMAAYDASLDVEMRRRASARDAGPGPGSSA